MGITEIAREHRRGPRSQELQPPSPVERSRGVTEPFRLERKARELRPGPRFAHVQFAHLMGNAGLSAEFGRDRDLEEAVLTERARLHARNLPVHEGQE